MNKSLSSKIFKNCNHAKFYCMIYVIAISIYCIQNFINNITFNKFYKFHYTLCTDILSIQQRSLQDFTGKILQG
ncbi:hypothetical protein V1477_011496 [Vespula maculifrons]|uniref:Uncharacterized protein n=1 Tax=Vespula maculifrons TaxID=7453 RepID=A0ABD2BZC7_VESMC